MRGRFKPYPTAVKYKIFITISVTLSSQWGLQGQGKGHCHNWFLSTWHWLGRLLVSWNLERALFGYFRFVLWEWVLRETVVCLTWSQSQAALDMDWQEFRPSSFWPCCLIPCRSLVWVLRSNWIIMHFLFWGKTVLQVQYKKISPGRWIPWVNDWMNEYFEEGSAVHGRYTVAWIVCFCKVSRLLKGKSLSVYPGVSKFVRDWKCAR